MSKAETATCRVCVTEKPLEQFRRDSRCKDGIDRECRPCRNKRESVGGTYERTNFRNLSRRAQANGSMDVLTFPEYLDVIQRPDCPYCGRERAEDERWHVDHVVTLKFAPNSYANITYCCPSCNSSKGNDDLLTFYERRDEFTPELLDDFIEEFGAKNAGNDYETMLWMLQMAQKREQLIKEGKAKRAVIEAVKR